MSRLRVPGRGVILRAPAPISPRAHGLQVGNPPFTGNKRMRGELGAAYVDALGRAPLLGSDRYDLHQRTVGFPRCPTAPI